eukprot:jgi/Chrpa1/11511/Chrysochromulina_OHIO_Genome00021090-RA
MSDDFIRMAIPLTAAQRAFGVDPVLVHLASLCVRPGRMAPFTKEEDNTFARAQLAYHAAVSGAKSPAPRLFKLTPLLVPPPMSSDANEPAIEPQQVASSEAYAAAAEARAAAAVAELLAMLECEAAAAAAAAARKTAKKRIAQADPTKKPTEGVTDERSQLAAGTARTGGRGGANACRFVGPTARATALETLDELTAARGVALGEYRAEEWTVVSKAPTPRRAHRVSAPAPPSAPPSVPPSSPPSVPPRAPTDGVAAKAEAEVAPAAASSDAACAPASEATEQAEQHLVIAPRTTPTCPQHTAPSWALGVGRTAEKGSLTAMPAAPPPAAPSAVPSAVPPAGLVENGQPGYVQRDDGQEDERQSLLRQIHELRNALRECESAHEHALASAHAAHQVALESALRAAQEREGMRLQALQLRLYIADTRVQTLEEACAQLWTRHERSQTLEEARAQLLTKDDRPLPNGRRGVLGGGAEADQPGALSTELEITKLEIPPRYLRADAHTLQAMQRKPTAASDRRDERRAQGDATRAEEVEDAQSIPMPPSNLDAHAAPGDCQERYEDRGREDDSSC